MNTEGSPDRLSLSLSLVFEPLEQRRLFGWSRGGELECDREWLCFLEPAFLRWNLSSLGGCGLLLVASDDSVMEEEDVCCC